MSAWVCGILSLVIVSSMALASDGAVTSFSDLQGMMGAFRESRILLSAVELDVFTAVGEGSTTEDVAHKLKTDPRATETLLNALVAVGALTKDQARFHNTPDTARFLVAGSPDYMRPALMHTVNMWDAWDTLTDCLRAGTAVRSPGVEAKDQQWTENFIAAMHRGAQTTARRLVAAVGASGVKRLLDIGGGSGAYSIEFAKANQKLHAEVFDLAEVVPIAQRYIQETGLTDRVTTKVGDLTNDEFGGDYDLILLSAICHMLSPEENQDLFRRCYRATAPGGRIVIRDFILEPNKTAPRSAAIFGLHMLVATRGGATYTEGEYRDWLQASGFDGVTRLEPPGDLIVASRQ